MTMNVLIGLFVLQVYLTYAYDFICPSQPHWNLRAKLMCMDQRNYSCLFDVNLQVNVYRDKCIRPRIVGPGYKYVFQPNPNRDSCRLSRYQPYIFNTTGYSECVLKKLPCSSEGQKTHTDGTTRSDRTCTCKQEIGYNFVSSPQNECYCNPSSEDCSCYLGIYPNKTLNECKGVSTYTEVNINLINFHGDKLNNSIAFTNKDFDNFKYNIAGIKNGYSTKAVINILILVFSYAVIGGVYILRRLIRKLSSKKGGKHSTERTMHQKEELDHIQNDYVSEDIRVSGIESDEEDNTTEQKMQNKELEQIQNKCIPDNIKMQIRYQIEGWEKNSKNFIRTRAYDAVLASFKSNSCIAVTGSSGSGKSAIVQQVSLLLSQTHGYKIIPITTATDLEKYYCPKKKTLFVVDNLCGKFTVNKQRIDDWNLKIDLVNQVIQDCSCKILFSCRLQVYKDPQFSRLKPFTSCECNINSAEICLTPNEKKLIFQCYLSSEIIEEEMLSETHENFPLLCEQFSKRNEKFNIEEFFKTPYIAYEQDLNELDTQGKEKLCGLCLCIIFNNQLKETDFETLSPDFVVIKKDICEHIGLPETTPATCLRKELDTLVETYVNKYNSGYEINHDKLFDFLAYYFGKKIPVCFIRHADSSIIRERFLWKEGDLSEEGLIENIVYLEDKYLSFYIERMILDWRKGNVSDVIYNINMTSISFRTKFLNKIDKKEAHDLANMNDCLSDGVKSGNTLLILACINDNIDLLCWLVQNEANVNHQRKDGASALCIACEKRHILAVSILLENKANANLSRKDGSTPLAIACYYHGDSEIIKDLLKGNASVNANEFKNMTPLFLACQNNFVRAAKILLEHKADPNICLKNGISALLVACQKKSTEMVRLLLKEKANPNLGKIDGSTPLFSASAMGLRDITELLLKENASIKKCVRNKEDIVESLKGKQNDLDRVKESWVTMVRSFGSDETMTYIQRIGKDQLIDFVFDVVAGSSPLHMACFMGKIETVQLLTTNALSVNLSKKNDIHATPLAYARAIEHTEIIKVLLQKGADS